MFQKVIDFWFKEIVLGRQSTPEEIEFPGKPGSSL
jgi:hypothetical protein